MGNHAMLVRFPDGKVKWGYYQSCADIGSPFLCDSYQDYKTGEAIHLGNLDRLGKQLATEQVVEVDVYLPYFQAHGKMRAHGGHLTSYVCPYEQEIGYGPQCDPPTITLTPGVPEWATSEFDRHR